MLYIILLFILKFNFIKSLNLINLLKVYLEEQQKLASSRQFITILMLSNCGNFSKD